MNDKILKRMRALLAMSKDSNSENESSIALRRLHVLLSKHNLSMIDVQDSDNTDPVGEDSFTMYIRPWHKGIIYNIAKLYFCDTYFGSRGRKPDIFVVGTDINRTFATGMIQSILYSINIQSQHAATAYSPSKDKRWSAFQTSFLSSATIRISKRCKDLIESSRRGELEDEEGNTLPVLASVYDSNALAINDFLSKIGLTKGKPSKLTITSRAGQAAGTAAGNKVQLTRSLQKQNTQKALS